ncbi:MAG: SAM-dependent methyltransferase [Bacteroidales bacterium]|nr:SAM-dependent methyltransferase [Bacteroidales bacterium]MDD4670131.1 SAM-dependent methyltransferase [Bacteroidales bacterium]
MNSRLFLVPTPLGDMEPSMVLPSSVMSLIPQIRLFFVEEIRTARRFLSAAGLKGHIDELSLYEINEHTQREAVEGYIKMLKTAPVDAALISEAGLPAVADPGALLVELAHNNDIEVIPLVGPSSLMLALMSSGMNGQCFAFTGYLPVKKEERRGRIVQLEKISQQQHQTQIIIETPYRNDSLFQDLLSVCRPSTRICIAADITLPTPFIKTKSVEQWRKSIPEIGKRPCVFVLQG